jgi:hypothetical protein
MHIGLARTLVVAPWPSVVYVDEASRTFSFWVPATSEVLDHHLPAVDPVTGATRMIVITSPVGSTRT